MLNRSENIPSLSGKKKKEIKRKKVFQPSSGNSVGSHIPPFLNEGVESAEGAARLISPDQSARFTFSSSAVARRAGVRSTCALKKTHNPSGSRWPGGLGSVSGGLHSLGTATPPPHFHHPPPTDPPHGHGAFLQDSGDPEKTDGILHAC